MLGPNEQTSGSRTNGKMCAERLKRTEKDWQNGKRRAEKGYAQARKRLRSGPLRVGFLHRQCINSKHGSQ